VARLSQTRIPPLRTRFHEVRRVRGRRMFAVSRYFVDTAVAACLHNSETLLDDLSGRADPRNARGVGWLQMHAPCMHLTELASHHVRH